MKTTSSSTDTQARSFDPTDTQRIEISQPKEWAAGIPAVLSAYKNVTSKAGPVKGTRLLTDLNQIEGFDCPGCAWPDPLAKRATFEFCENGAKAVADARTIRPLVKRSRAPDSTYVVT